MKPSKTFLELLDKYGVEPIHHKPQPQMVRRFGLVAHADVQEPIGTTGTQTWAGEISVETNPEYHPHFVRGSWGEPGLYEELYRSEPQIFDAVNERCETLVAGTFELQMPERVNPDMEQRLQELVLFHGTRIKNIYGGWDNFVEHASTGILKFGFTPFEIIWAHGKTRSWVHDLQFREQATVERWQFNERQTQMIGCEFATGVGGNGRTYTLPATGPRVGDCRLMVVNVNAQGNNVEGISPIRPSLHYCQFKQLLMQIAAVMAEKYGVPITYVYEDPQAAQAMMVANGMGDDEEMDDVYDVIEEMSAVDATVLTLPGAIRIGTTNPTNQMPSFKDLIDYCDQMIRTPFNNEGALLGMQGAVGSYALGEVKEREALSSAPYYARRICVALDKLTRRIVRAELGDMVEYPKWVWRIDGMQDSGKWLADVRSLLPNVPLTQYPPKLKEAVLSRLDLPLDALDGLE